MFKLENSLKDKHQMLTYFNFAMSSEFWNQQGLKYLLTHKDKIILKIVLRKVCIYWTFPQLNYFWNAEFEIYPAGGKELLAILQQGVIPSLLCFGIKVPITVWQMAEKKVGGMRAIWEVTTVVWRGHRGRSEMVTWRRMEGWGGSWWIYGLWSW